MNGLLVAKFNGSRYEMGFNHGKSFKNEINHSIKTHCHFAIPKAQMANLYTEIELNLKKYFPEVVEELKGIADGSDNDFGEIVKLNYWEEINACHNNGSAGQCCTSIAFKNTPIGPMMGKTTDIEIEQRNEYMLQWIYPDQGNKIIQLGKVGTIKSEVGMNEKGLCIGTSSTLPMDIQGSQIERMMLIRQTLQHCDNVNEAVEFLTKYRFFVLGLNILLLDAACEAVVLEKGIAHQKVRRTDTDIIYATNFFLCKEMIPFYDDTAWYYENAFNRYRNLENLFTHNNGAKDILLMERILRDHSGDGAICNHNPNLDTFYATILVPRKMTFYLTDGRPCESEFKEYFL